jgi:hypothetical protein
MKPAARSDLAMCNVRDEVVVYDFRSHQARCLNPTAAAVFGLCDGTRTPRQIAAALEPGLAAPVDEELVWMALDTLDGHGLLDPPLGRTRTNVGRRRLLKKMALTAGLSIALPAVWSIVAPTPAYAASTIGCVPPLLCLLGEMMANVCCNNNGMAGTCSGASCSGTSSTCHGQTCMGL